MFTKKKVNCFHILYMATSNLLWHQLRATKTRQLELGRCSCFPEAQWSSEFYKKVVTYSQHSACASDSPAHISLAMHVQINNFSKSENARGATSPLPPLPAVYGPVQQSEKSCKTSYRITRMFCEHQIFANFEMVDQCNNKIRKS